MMRVIAVTARLARPGVFDGPLHLDALMSARHPAMHTREATVTRQGGRVQVAPLSLCTARLDRDWVWCATAWVPPAPDAAIALVKRRDGIDYHMTNRTVYPSVGPERDRLRRFPTVTADPQWLATVPDSRGYKELRRICRRVEQIGGLRKAGYGLVAGWEFEEVERDPLDCLALADKAQRTLPASMWASEAPCERMATIPPYWASAEAKPAYAPGTRGTLCSQITIS